MQSQLAKKTKDIKPTEIKRKWFLYRKNKIGWSIRFGKFVIRRNTQRMERTNALIYKSITFEILGDMFREVNE